MRAGPAAAGAEGDAILPVTLESVGYRLGARALLDAVDLELGERGRTLLVGPNGAGKTLLLRLLHGLAQPTSGRLRWHCDDAETRARAQAMVFQRPVLLRRSVVGNVRYALAARGLPRRERAAVCDELLERTGLAPLAGRPARRLSGGEQQRVAIARAWAVGPQLLLLDEPTANLDPAAVRAVEDLIQAIHASGTRVVMTSHDLGQVQRLADDVVFLHRGRVLEHAPVGAFFEAPSSPEARDFVSGKLLA